MADMTINSYMTKSNVAHGDYLKSESKQNPNADIPIKLSSNTQGTEGLELERTVNAAKNSDTAAVAETSKNVSKDKPVKSLTLEQRLASNNPNEVLKAVNEQFATKYTDKETGENLTAPQIVAKFAAFQVKTGENAGSLEDLCVKFKEETGIEITNVDNHKYGGITFDVDNYWVSLPEKLPWGRTEHKIGKKDEAEELIGKLGVWNPEDGEIPATKGTVFMVTEYWNPNTDGNIYDIKFKRDNNSLEPTGATMTLKHPFNKGVEKQYQPSGTIDPKIHNFYELP